MKHFSYPYPSTYFPSFLTSVAHGACVQAAVIAQKLDAPSIYVRNVTPLTIGIIGSKTERECCPVIKRNTQYPTEAIVYGKTTKDNQVKAKITIFEGEHETKAENEVLGSMVLRKLGPSSKGDEIVKIFLKLSDKGIISEESIQIDRPQLFTNDQIEKFKKTHDELKVVDPQTQTQIETETINSCEIFKRMKVELKKEFDVKCPIYGQRKLIYSSEISLVE